MKWIGKVRGRTNLSAVVFVRGRRGIDGPEQLNILLEALRSRQVKVQVNLTNARSASYIDGWLCDREDPHGILLDLHCTTFFVHLFSEDGDVNVSRGLIVINAAFRELLNLDRDVG